MWCLFSKGEESHCIFLTLCFFALHSGGTFPDDDGSRQEVKNSLFVGESGNRGMHDLNDQSWGPGGPDHLGRSLPRGTWVLWTSVFPLSCYCTTKHYFKVLWIVRKCAPRFPEKHLFNFVAFQREQCLWPWFCLWPINAHIFPRNVCKVL